MREIELPIEEIVRKYENGINPENIAKEYRVSYSTINRKINQYYENIEIERPFLKRGGKKIELPIEDIVEKYEKGTNTEKIAREYGISYSTIDSRLKDYYKEIGVERPFLKRGETRIELPIEEIVEKYENGTNPENIAKEYGISYCTIYSRLKEYYKKIGEKRPFLKRGGKRIEIQIERIVEKYENGTSISELAEEYRISYNTINGRLKSYYAAEQRKVPRVLKSLSLIEEYLEKGLTIEEITQIASNKNIIIPQDLINTLFSNKDIADEER